jgi:hypothetical protein
MAHVLDALLLADTLDDPPVRRGAPQRLEEPLGAHRAVIVGLVADEHPLGGDADELVIGDVDRADEPADAAAGCPSSRRMASSYSSRTRRSRSFAGEPWLRNPGTRPLIKVDHRVSILGPVIEPPVVRRLPELDHTSIYADRLLVSCRRIQ